MSTCASRHVFDSLSAISAIVASVVIAAGRGRASSVDGLAAPPPSLVNLRSFCLLQVGSEVFELFAVKGETDDGTLVWMPRRRFLFCGDLWIWNAPNAGSACNAPLPVVRARENALFPSV
jgi:hypothetical protein